MEIITELAMEGNLSNGDIRIYSGKNATGLTKWLYGNMAYETVDELTGKVLSELAIYSMKGNRGIEIKKLGVNPFYEGNGMFNVIAKLGTLDGFLKGQLEYHLPQFKLRRPAQLGLSLLLKNNDNNEIEELNQVLEKSFGSKGYFFDRL